MSRTQLRLQQMTGSIGDLIYSGSTTSAAQASANTATTQATNAATSASTASTQATNAAASATTASTQASNAATSATTALNNLNSFVYHHYLIYLMVVPPIMYQIDYCI